MVVQVIAAEIGERRRCQLNAVEPVLIETVRRRFEREVRRFGTAMASLSSSDGKSCIQGCYATCRRGKVKKC